MSINATIILSTMLETCYSGTTQMFDNTTAPYPISLSLICVPCFLHIKGVIFYYGKTYSRAILNGIEMEENVVLGQHIGTTHLSKGPSYLKQKCTQLPTPFSGTVSNALSLGSDQFCSDC